jgi:hypothetical protein
LKRQKSITRMILVTCIQFLKNETISRSWFSRSSQVPPSEPQLPTASSVSSVSSVQCWPCAAVPPCSAGASNGTVTVTVAVTTNNATTTGRMWGTFAFF